MPLLWLAGPMTGLLVQPLIGAMSDRTVTRLGPAHALFPGRRHAVQPVPVRDAVQPRAVDRSQPAMDAGRRQQRDAWSPTAPMSATGWRPPAPARLPDAERLHRPGADAVLSCAVAAGLGGDERGRARRQRHPGHHPDRLRRRCGHLAVDDPVVGVARARTAADAGRARRDARPAAVGSGRRWHDFARRRRARCRRRCASWRSRCCSSGMRCSLLAVYRLRRRPRAVPYRRRGTPGFRDAVLLNGQVGGFYNFVAFVAAFAMVPFARRFGAQALPRRLPGRVGHRHDRRSGLHQRGVAAACRWSASASAGRA